jgi:hypothetical protein
MAQKSRKVRKQKKTPVRIISPQTVQMSVEPPVASESKKVEPKTTHVLDVRDNSSTLIPEIKRIGVVAATITILLIVLSFIF